MKLPTEKTKVVDHFGDANVLIYGNPKSGKTSLASQFPDALFLATEKGYNFLEILKVDINCWGDLLEAQRLLKEDKKYKTLIIDTVDHLWRYCETYVCETNNVTDVADLAYGKGFKLVKKTFVDKIMRLNQLGFGLVFISHSKLTEQESKARKFTRIGTSLSNSPETAICGLCDLILYCYIDKDGNRRIRTKPSEGVLAGDRTGKLPKDIDMNYETLIKEFKKAVKQTEKGN